VVGAVYRKRLIRRAIRSPFAILSPEGIPEIEPDKVRGRGMPTKILVRCKEADSKTRREAAAQRVVEYFGKAVSDPRLLCFLDGEEWGPFADRVFGIGPCYRGFYAPLKETTPGKLCFPEYLTDQLFDDSWMHPSRVFDHLVYVRASTCSDEAGLTMTLAHEFQHFVQHSEVRKLWAVNDLITRLLREVIPPSKMQSQDIPIEREAIIVSRCVAEELCGREAVAAYVEGKLAEATAENDVKNWQFVRDLDARASFDLAGETRAILQRLTSLKPQLERALQTLKSVGDPDFVDVDLEAFARGPIRELRATASG